MYPEKFITIVARGLLRGYRCQIDGAEFVESDQISRQECWHLCRQHTARLIFEQDGDQVQTRTLQERQTWHLYERDDLSEGS